MKTHKTHNGTPFALAICEDEGSYFRILPFPSEDVRDLIFNQIIENGGMIERAFLEPSRAVNDGGMVRIYSMMKLNDPDMMKVYFLDYAPQEDYSGRQLV